MITSLTTEQEAKIKDYYEEGMKIGHSCEPLDKELAKKAVLGLCAIANIKAPTEFVFLPSPLACQVAYNKLAGNKTMEFDSQYYNPWWWIGYYQFYSFILNELFPERKDEFPLLKEITEYNKNIHYIQVYDTTAFISERPVHIKKNAQGLHCDDDAALKYGDGYGVYSLNGVSLDAEVVMTSKDDLDVSKYLLQERNAEKRREVFRKLGSELVVKKLGGKLIDQYTMDIDGDQVKSIFGKEINQYRYELYEVDLGNGNKNQFLKMINPSIDAEHFEAVPKGITTVQEAISFRNHLTKFQKPSILT